MLKITWLGLGLCTLPFCSITALAADIKVNGRTIPEAELRITMAERQAVGITDTEALQKVVREQLIARELFSQQAGKTKLDKEDDIKARIRMAREEVLSRQYQAQYLAQHVPPEPQVRAAYDALKQRAGDKEFLVRQIFVLTVDEAKAIGTRLAAGEKFDALARSLSKDEGSRANGGDLGWLSPLQLQPHVLGPVVALQAGQASAPVKGPSGWHVIRVDEIRPLIFPALEQLAQQIRRDLSRRALEQHLAELLRQATIQ